LFVSFSLVAFSGYWDAARDMSKKQVVFGIGLPKTATQTLAHCLYHLGYAVVHNPKEYWDLLHMGATRFPQQPYQWEAMVHFAVRQYRMLDRSYPDCKFILTVRDKESWLKSCKRQFSSGFVYEPTQAAIRVNIFGTTDFDPSLYSDVYDEHLWGVSRFFNEIDQSRWEIWDIPENPNWQPLCDLLDKPLPDLVFPVVNDFVGNRARFEAKKREAGLR
jgi:hypothetical protein